MPDAARRMAAWAAEAGWIADVDLVCEALLATKVECFEWHFSNIPAAFPVAAAA